ncbi:MAG: protein phosphatase CheZ [Proteobacteria bacterium]|nr:protein phosphatase CheZ [Pseudomonadota bacterium]
MEITELQKNLRDLIDSVPDAKEDVLQKLVFELKSFLQYIEQVDKSAADEVLKSLESTSDNMLFQEVGKLLRRFHDQLVLIREGIPEDLGRIASQEVVEMSERLQMIVSMTDKAANKTMDLTEGIMDTIGNQGQTLDQISDSLNSVLANGSLDPELAKTIESALNQVKEITGDNTDTQNKLTEILIAQDYQDLTGQVIFKVINLLKSLESDLAQLIDRFGQVLIEAEQVNETNLKGPLDEEDKEKSSQGDVDALLTKFGF